MIRLDAPHSPAATRHAASPGVSRFHVLPGRLRLDILGMKHDAGLCEAVVMAARALPGVRRVEGSPWTGRVLLLFDRAATTAEEVETGVAEARASAIASRAADHSGTNGHGLSAGLSPHLRIGAGESPAIHEGQTKKQHPRVTTRPWHAVEVTDVLREFTTRADIGLGTGEAHRRLRRHGANRLAEVEPPSWARLFFSEMVSVVTLALLGAAGATLLLGKARDGVVIAGIVVVNAALGALQNFRADRSLRALRALSSPRARVLRSSQIVELPAEELVPGDVVLLREGDGVPADVRLIKARGLEVDESALTGESAPVMKSHDTCAPETPLAERVSAAYLGTNVVAGRAKAVVIGTGMNTEMGRITRLLGRAEERAGPLQQRMEGLVVRLLWGSAAAGAIIAGAGLLRGEPFLPMLLTAISVAVAAVPEGLPIFVTIAQASAVRRMARRQMLVRRLSALETLARVSVVCCDKTGTLTQNEMTVRVLTDGRARWEVTPTADGRMEFYAGEHFAAHAEARHAPRLERLLTLGVLANSAMLVSQTDGNGNGSGERLIQGSRSEAALLLAAEGAGLDLERLRAGYRKCAEAAFDPSRRDSRVLYERPEGDYLLLVKGAPEAILPICRQWRPDEEPRALDSPERARLLKDSSTLAGEALRLFALASQRFDAPLSDEELDRFEPDLVFEGVFGLKDPPRREVPAALAVCRRAGIEVAMITGDHPETARALACELGLTERGARLLTGPEIDAMDDAALQEAARGVTVFARVTPEHKLRIVAALQRDGRRVAMTGDGVNDAPAVRLADVGVSMGRRAAEVTRQSSALILTDDRLTTLTRALAEGRAIQSNLRGALGFLLGGNLGEALFLGLAVMAGMPVPLLPGQILLLNLLSDALPIIAIVGQPPSARTLAAPSPPGEERVINASLYREIGTRGAATGAAALAAFAAGLRATGGSLVAARSIGFATIVGSQFLQIATEAGLRRGMDTEGRRTLGAALGLSVLGLVGCLHLPLMQRLFDLGALNRLGWGIALASSTAASGLLRSVLPRIAGTETDEGGMLSRRSLDPGREG
jgi:Ca2+-transporting ATPase